MMPPPFDAEPGQEPSSAPLTWRDWCVALIVAALAIGGVVFGPGAGAS